MKTSAAFRRYVQLALHALLGDISFSWRPPQWLRRTGQGIARRPIVSLLAFLALLGAFIGGWLLWNGWKNRPQPLLTDWIAQAPGVADPSNQFEPQMLSVSFDRSVAALAQIGKPSLQGVTLAPPLPGNWRWTSGSSLIFEPKQDWPAGTEYRITFSRQIFSNHARITTLSKTYTTAPFTGQLSDLVFYINPKDPATKQVTATFTFSHPVDRNSLQGELKMDVQGTESIFAGDPPHFTLTYDKRDRVVYFRSANTVLPQLSTYLRLTLPQTIKPAAGDATLADETHQDVLIPSQFDLFHVNSADVVIVKDKDAEPSQALILNTSVGIKPDVLNGHIHAYVLPSHFDSDHHPKPWAGPAEIDTKVLAGAKETDLIPIASEETYTSAPSFRLKVPENAQVYVVIDKGIKSLGDFPLRDEYDAVCGVPAFEREVRLMYDGSLLALNGERKLSVSSRGVDELEYRLARVNPGEINHLVSQSEGSFQSPVFNSDNFGESDMAETVVRRDAIANTDAAQRNSSSFDFSEFVNDNDANEGKLGLFILHLYGRKTSKNAGYYQQDGGVLRDTDLAQQNNNNGEKARPEDTDTLLSDRRLILVTDLGLIVKDNADQTHDVFVQSIKTGEPVGGAKVMVLGRNGLPLLTVETDDQGRAPIPSLADFAHEKLPVAYVAQLGRDVSFLPFGREDRELNLSRFDTSGLEGIKPEDLTTFLFTDRGIYRPGDEVKLGLVVKQHNWRGNLQGVPLELDIIDPRGQTVQARVLNSDATGFLETTFPSRETSITGEYQADCYLVKDKDNKTLLGESSFRVKDFLPDRLKITAKLLGDIPEGWIAQKGLQAEVTLRNLYGSAAAGNRMRGKLTLMPSQFGFAKYPDYNFTDPYLDPNANRKSYELDLPEQTTNDDGQATFALDATGMEPSAYQLSFLAEGLEKGGGRSVTAYTGVQVSPSAWLLGTKPDGDFSYVDHDSKHSVRLLAVDPHLTSIAVDHLTLKLVEQRYVAVLVQEPNGNYGYESVLKEIPVEAKELSVAAGGTDWPLETDAPGDFAARFYNGQGDLMADVRYSVAGAGNLTRALEKNAELTAKLSKPEYKAGEDIEVQITAPYTGAGLITIERDKVYATQWFKATSTSSVQKIRLPADFEGNGYLNVAFVRGLDSKEIYMSPLSYAVLPFKVDQEARHTRLTIAAPQVAVPGQPLTWTVTASRPTRAVVYAVDEGILQVAGYQLPDPLAYFFQKEALGVGTRQTVDQILPEYSIAREVAATGGDSGADLLAHHLNPFKRKHDAPVAYWSGVIDLGPQAKSFTYNVPDYFAGTLRIMVVAASPDAVGSAQTTTQVRGPFVISPNVPTFLAPGDTFDLSVTIANNIKGSGPDAPVDCFLSTTDGLEIVQKPSAAVPISEGKDTSVHWLLRSKDLLGNADITVTAHHDGATSSLVSHLSIRPPVAFLTTLDSGYFTDSQKRIDLTRKLYPQFHANAVTASIVPQGFSRGLGDYLEHYEYGCTEQLISKAFPSLVSNDTMQQGQTQAEVQQHLQAIYDVLASRQNDQGAFGYWQPETNVHFDLPSLWAVQLLTEAKERGYDIPDTMLTRALDHLRDMAKDQPDNFDDARSQAEAIYLLTRNGVVTTNFLEHNRGWFEDNAKDTWGDDIADAYVASSYALLKNQKQADALIGRFHLVGAQMQAEDDFYDELGRDSVYIDLLAHHFPERLHRLRDADLIALARPIMDGDYTTLSAAQAILALDDYGHAVAKDSTALTNLSIDEVTGTTTHPLDLSAGLYPTGSFGVDVDALLFHQPQHSAIGLPGLFYQVTQSGFDHTTATTPISEGIEVSREYQDQAGQPTTTAKLGDELNVVLRVRGVGDRDITNVAILDLLPGGFEVVPESIQTGTCNYGGIDYADVHEDRVAVFGTVNNQETTITYRIKATNKGTYAVPPPQAEAMYHLKIRARGVSGQLTVTD
jgi:alpha-2-macroglobulin